MSDLRKAAEAALEALEIASRNGADGLKRYELKELDDTIADLRAALAQPEQDLQLVANLLKEYGLEALEVIAALKTQPEQTAMPPDIAKVLFDNVESLYVADDLPQLTKWTPMAEYAAKSAAVPGRAKALKQAGYTRRPRQLPKEDEQEPVAWNWVLDGKDYGPVYYGKPPDADITKQAEQRSRTVRLLYTFPPQRKPLRYVTYVCPICAASLERQE